MSRRKQYGLTLAGVGIGIAGVGLITDTGTTAMFIASSVLVAAGVLTFVWKAKNK